MAPAHTNVFCVLFQLIDNNFSEWQSEYGKRVMLKIKYTFSQYYKTDRIILKSNLEFGQILSEVILSDSGGVIKYLYFMKEE